ncbi:lactonase family protein [Sessilibacter sp. MAH2]
MKLSKKIMTSAALVAATTLAISSAHASYLERVATLSNAAEGNELLIFTQTKSNGLVLLDSVSTGGFGTGAPLVSNQDALIVSDDGDFIYGVNTGSNSISVFKIGRKGVKLIQTIDSQGDRPISLTQTDDLLYVVNEGTDNIAGYKVKKDGKLEILENSVASLSGSGTAPAQISFSPDGDFLIVTEKLTNLIVTYPVLEDGRPGELVATTSALPVPFGFDFDRFGHVVVSEAAVPGGPDIGLGAGVSSYELEADGSLSVLTGGVLNSGRAACWVEFSKNGRVAYVTNTVSNSVSVYTTNRHGDLTLANDIAATLDAGFPSDIALSQNSRVVYVLSNAGGFINSFSVEDRTGLVSVSETAELPSSANGLVTF